MRPLVTIVEMTVKVNWLSQNKVQEEVPNFLLILVDVHNLCLQISDISTPSPSPSPSLS